MCILLATIRHPDYKLILISNRDEFFERKTHPTCWNHNNFILSPYDMAVSTTRKDFGTWLGINKKGRIAVILNLRINTENVDKVDGTNEIKSRGFLPVSFLDENSYSTYDEWDTWDKYASKYADLKNTGPFTMFYGDALKDKFSVIDCLKHSTDPFANSSDVVITNNVYTCETNDDGFKWPKIQYGYEFLDALVKNTGGIEKADLLTKCFELASNHHATEGEDENYVSRSNIFVTPLKNLRDQRYGMPVAGGNYFGTRSQIVLLIDHQNHVTLEERVLYESDKDVELYSFENPKQKFHFEFDILE